jgi:hypothetical protein
VLPVPPGLAELHTAHTISPMTSTATPVMIISTGRILKPFFGGTTALGRDAPGLEPVVPGLAVPVGPAPGLAALCWVLACELPVGRGPPDPGLAALDVGLPFVEALAWLDLEATSLLVFNAFVYLSGW